MRRDCGLKTGSSRKNHGRPILNAQRAGQRPKELQDLQPDNRVWKPSKRQEERRGVVFWVSTGQLSPGTI